MVKQPQIIDMLTAGMRGASARQTVIAENIANAQTPGYRRRVLEFENVLAKALESGDVTSGALDARVVMPDSTPANETGNNVDLEMEIGELLKNSSTYKTYLRVLNKVYRQMELAMTVQ
jgi:flagellar basal-body rod protein FlgB